MVAAIAMIKKKALGRAFCIGRKFDESENKNSGATRRYFYFMNK